FRRHFAFSVCRHILAIDRRLLLAVTLDSQTTYINRQSSLEYLAIINKSSSIADFNFDFGKEGQLEPEGLVRIWRFNQQAFANEVYVASRRNQFELVLPVSIERFRIFS
ncbi:hypothetical protein M8C21_014208, partial [Ambrosia artemisiifolia]